MIISKKKFQEEIEKAKEQVLYEAQKRRDDEDQFRFLHERIERLERMVYKLQAAVKPEEDNRKCCEPVRG